MIFESIALVYLCRGIDESWEDKAQKFIYSYIQNRPGIEHNLYIIYKGFDSEKSLITAQRLFANIKSSSLYLSDHGYDIAAYISASKKVNEKFIIFLNSHSRIICKDWLLKLYLNLIQPGIKLVGATASFESLDVYPGFPSFPNPHIRTNAFMINRIYFIALTNNIVINNKMDAMLFESGKKSLTNMVLRDGDVRVVGKNGMGYPINFWPVSKIFKESKQDNLMVSDNQTDSYIVAPYFKKRYMKKKAWG